MRVWAAVAPSPTLDLNLDLNSNLAPPIRKQEQELADPSLRSVFFAVKSVPGPAVQEQDLDDERELELRSLAVARDQALFPLLPDPVRKYFTTASREVVT